MSQYHEGPYGQGYEIPLPRKADAASTVCWWLIDAPAYHPLWSQYVLCVLRLTDPRPDLGSPHLKFEGATHEVTVFAVSPDWHWTSKKLAARGGIPPYLTPVNISEQYEATDAEMEEIASLCVKAVTNGSLNPETADAPERIRESWLTVIVKTLAHIRGEEHAP